MTLPTTPEGQGPSTRPYLIRALHDWCTDNGFTPYLAVFVDEYVRVPSEYVKNGEIVLNVSFEATSGLRLGNEFIEFKARFGGVARDILVPVDHVVAIYARENGQGMAFPMPGELVAGRSSPRPAPTLPDAAPQPERTSPKIVRLGGGTEAMTPQAAASPEPPQAPEAPEEPPSASVPQAPRPRRAEDPSPKPPGRPTLKRIK